MTKKTRQRKAGARKESARRAVNVFAWLYLCWTIGISIVSFVAAMSGDNNGQEIFGYKFLIVNTDSMSKSTISEEEEIFFEAGDIIVVRVEVNPATLEVGDVITFFSYNPESLGKTVTHKIRKINYTNTGEVSGFITYGINTGANDTVEVRPEYVIGKYVNKVPKMGSVFSFLKTPRGFYLSIVIPAVLLIIYFSVQVLSSQEFCQRSR